ncbi:hypothetical protein C0Q70_03093 [Pomacea canaliculata]|uniref:Uncharacterized protein n=1 Tax=Pomacea canaliculata TaxID=400727 RepID=A0A2T7PRV4_POMCA|nr:hypothetical protein C0Q70_03093 [Pomacea canaliculata]
MYVYSCCVDKLNVWVLWIRREFTAQYVFLVISLSSSQLLYVTPPDQCFLYVTNSFAAEVTWSDAFMSLEVSSDGLSAGRTKVLTGRVTVDDDDDDDKLVRCASGEQGGGRAESGKDKAPVHREEEGSDENKGGAGWGLLTLLTLAAMTVYARLLLVSSRLALLKVCLTRPCLSDGEKRGAREGTLAKTDMSDGV